MIVYWRQARNIAGMGGNKPLTAAALSKLCMVIEQKIKGIVTNEFRYLAGVTDLKPACVLFTYLSRLGEGS
jgi:hypothetical protein